ncbi:N-6 DNA methylase [Spirosoma fluviale]|uniref:Type I restriction enzyme M protein n=1 Tax=Spirosoma fluviale TaxID=1597977 RepID=A0A286G1A3_9BACT|nr:N-6 DNA methylase [Spirosoma fluviale]SOD89273.1 type I restriction enzyme M protein [Spirosoma fluviale]
MVTEIKTRSAKIYAPLKGKDLVATPEEQVRQEYIVRLMEQYGYAKEQMGQEIQVNNSQRGQGQARADIVIWKSKEDKAEENSPIIVVECKAEYITVREEDYFQGYNYASWAGADFFVTTNLKETRIFQVVKGKIPKRLIEIIDIPMAKDINNERKLKDLLSQTKAFTRDEFSKLLFKCHNIIRNNDKLSPEAAFDEISKILFIKIRYERTNSKGQIFSEEQFKQDKEAHNRYMSPGELPFYQRLFESTKNDFKNDDLFDTNETIRIRESSFEAIVKELQKYNLSTTSDDVKGIAFEQFLGRTFRGELGQFFTPRTVVDFMVDVLDPQEGEVLCDPCCGSGGFLIKAFEYVRAKIEDDIHQAKDEIKKRYYNDDYDKASSTEKQTTDELVNDLFAKLNYELDINNPNSRLRKLSYDCIYGTDANPRMARTAKMNMIMHGDGHGGVHHNDGLLNVNGIFEGRFDVILTNPPFGARVEKSLKITEADKYTNQERIQQYRERYGLDYDKALSQINDHIGESVLDQFTTGKMSSLTEVLFIERCLNLLRPGGRIGIVLPEGVLNNPMLQRVRDYFESQAKIIFITSIPQDVFIASGATVKPSILFLRKFTDEETERWQQLKAEASQQAYDRYAVEWNTIQDSLSRRGKDAVSATEKKTLRARLNEIQQAMDTEIRAQVKKDFDYQIPIAEVEKAGISSTGAPCENDLEPLAKEFGEYRRKENLWKEQYLKISYEQGNDNSLLRWIGSESTVLYNKASV